MLDALTLHLSCIIYSRTIPTFYLGSLYIKKDKKFKRQLVIALSYLAHSWVAAFSKQPTFRGVHRNSLLVTCHHPDLGSASDWFKQISLAVRQIRSTSQIWVVIRHQYGIYTLVPLT